MAKKAPFIVTPWEIKGKIDYDLLIHGFGVQKIEPVLLERIKRLTGELHFMLRRGIFFAHRDLDWLISEYEKGNKFYLYTGRGPSGDVHIGHLMPWLFTKWLQDKFDATLLFQLTDDEKFLFKDELTQAETRRLAYENALDFIAIGFKPGKTKIFTNLEYCKTQYPLALEVAKRVTFSTARAVFGFNASTNIGCIFFTSMQSVPCFLPSIWEGKPTPVLVPLAVDQDAHFRITRDVAPKLGYPKPALIHCKFAPSLVGEEKMSASAPEYSLFAIDSPEVVERKIMNAFTGGRATIAEQRRLGGQPEICAVYKYFAYIFEPSDAALQELRVACISGNILCSECKHKLLEKVAAFLRQHQLKRQQARKQLHKYLLKD